MLKKIRIEERPKDQSRRDYLRKLLEYSENQSDFYREDIVLKGLLRGDDLKFLRDTLKQEYIQKVYIKPGSFRVKWTVKFL